MENKIKPTTLWGIYAPSRIIGNQLIIHPYTWRYIVLLSYSGGGVNNLVRSYTILYYVIITRRRPRGEMLCDSECILFVIVMCWLSDGYNNNDSSASAHIWYIYICFFVECVWKQIWVYNIQHDGDDDDDAYLIVGRSSLKQIFTVGMSRDVCRIDIASFAGLVRSWGE